MLKYFNLQSLAPYSINILNWMKFTLLQMFNYRKLACYDRIGLFTSYNNCLNLKLCKVQGILNFALQNLSKVSIRTKECISAKNAIIGHTLKTIVFQCSYDLKSKNFSCYHQIFLFTSYNTCRVLRISEILDPDPIRQLNCGSVSRSGPVPKTDRLNISETNIMKFYE